MQETYTDAAGPEGPMYVEQLLTIHMLLSFAWA